MTITATGCDYSDPQTPIRVLQAHGAQFVCRYASTPGNPKNLTAGEVATLRAAGIGIVSVFQTTAMRALDGFQAGADDAVSAWDQFAALGMPHGKPIYFTVDFDMQLSQESAVAGYFDGITSALPVDEIGVYGGKAACEFVHGSGRASFAWQTYAWSVGLWAVTTHIRQTANGVNWSGFGVDLDEAHEVDFGAWGGTPTPTPTPVPTPPNWTEAMIANMPDIREGANDTGQSVWYVHRIQAILTYVIGDAPIAVDGAFGPHTDASVRAFQGRYGLAVDGIVGPHTWAQLLAGQPLS